MQSNFRFCALVLAATLCGCAAREAHFPPPGSDPQVTLKIQQSSMPGYLTTYGSNGQMYFYQFSGGNKQHGNLEFKVGNGGANIHIMLNASSNFAIKDVPLVGNSNNQLTPSVENATKAKIRNENTDVLDAYYALKIVDNTDPAKPADIICDPGIINNR